MYRPIEENAAQGITQADVIFHKSIQLYKKAVQKRTNIIAGSITTIILEIKK